MKKSLLLAVLVCAMSVARPSLGEADTLDLTGSVSCATDSRCTTDGVTEYWSFAGLLWSVTQTQPTGSGYIDSFVRIQDAGPSPDSLVVDGHNTSGTLLNDEKPGPTFTHDVLTADLSTTPIDGTNYYQFLLDINQEGGDPLLSLSGLQLCTSTKGKLSFDGTCAGYDGDNDNQVSGNDTGWSYLKYDLDASGDNEVLLNYLLNHGSGSGDLFVYVPQTLLEDVDGSTKPYLYLWSEFGMPVEDENNNNDGYEEWAFIHGIGGGPCTFNCNEPLTGAPEPATLVMLGSGLLFCAATMRRRNRKQAAA